MVCLLQGIIGSVVTYYCTNAGPVTDYKQQVCAYRLIRLRGQGRILQVTGWGQECVIYGGGSQG